mmetsp:Transcript_4447/g.10131  ORF Transcript_4447/g.10131 Transcript_4447/m.10131 type:complete len:614 (-) Transcript_4447:950-2791(-)
MSDDSVGTPNVEQAAAAAAAAGTSAPALPAPVAIEEGSSTPPLRTSTSTSTVTTPNTTSTSTSTSTTAAKKKKSVRRIVRKKKGSGSAAARKNEISDVVDPGLLEKVMLESNLPRAYSFEIVKTLKRINQILQAKAAVVAKSKTTIANADSNIADSTTTERPGPPSVHIALQMPEGLLLYATVLSDVLQRLVAATNKAPTGNSSNNSNSTTTTTTSEDYNNNNNNNDQQQPRLRVSVLGDVTYGACCVDDLGARALGCDLLVHYGHSCLVPIQHTVVPCLYVFVEITIDVPHLVECFHKTILVEYNNGSNNGSSNDSSNNNDTVNNKPHVYLLGTIQFRHALMEARRLLRSEPYDYELSIPQAKPLSPGEVLGCTSPALAGGGGGGGGKAENNTTTAVVLFVADGRFHLESTMISNPHIAKFYRYDPYPKTLTEESYDHVKMKSLRYEAIQKARLKIQAKKQQNASSDDDANASTAAVFGIILGTLGRQGNPALLTKIRLQLRRRKLKSFVVLASEITPSKLSLFRKKVDAWVQIACPRLSVDWGHALSGDSSVPVLNPYELFVCLDEVEWRKDESYPMDYYSQEGGPWSNYHDVDNKGREFTLPDTTTTTVR